MPKEFSRTQRVSEQIQRDLAHILQTEFNDPRVGMVTVSEVSVSTDLSVAKVYVTFLEVDECSQSNEKAVKLLNQASNYIRTCLGKSMRLRSVPSLRFYYDESLARGQYLSALIDKANKR